MLARFYNGKEIECNFGIIIEGQNSGKPSYLDSPEIMEIMIDGQWAPNHGYNLAKYKSQKLLLIEEKLLQVFRDKQICENNNLREKFDSLMAEQEKLENEKEEISAL